MADAQGECGTLVAKWRAGNIEVLPGVPDEQLLALEGRFGLRLPNAFRAYLGVAGGMGHSGLDEGLIHFWTLGEIARHLSEPGSLERWPFLPFADYSIECWVWALPFGAGGNVLDSVCTYGPPLLPCAPTFSAFIGMYLREEDISPKELGPRVRPHWKAD
jgi:hypothetical protein